MKTRRVRYEALCWAWAFFIYPFLCLGLLPLVGPFFPLICYQDFRCNWGKISIPEMFISTEKIESKKCNDDQLRRKMEMQIFLLKTVVWIFFFHLTKKGMQKAIWLSTDLILSLRGSAWHGSSVYLTRTGDYQSPTLRHDHYGFRRSRHDIGENFNTLCINYVI
jgi:hypothetical protein